MLYSYLFILLMSCNRQPTDEELDEATCENIRNATLTSNSPVTTGNTITFSAPEVGGYRMYHWTGPNLFTSQYADNTIDPAELHHEGWYYLHLSNSSCEAKFDSIYIDVKLAQATPPCNAPNNTAEYSNLFDDTFSNVRKRTDATTSRKILIGTGSGSDLTVYFHQYWDNKEPEDGLYKTTNVLSFSGKYNQVYVSTVKQSIFFSSHESQNVYVSHVNGKLKVQLCNLPMGGYNGTSYTTQVSSTMTEL